MCQRKPACYRLNSPFYLRIRYRLALLQSTFLFAQLVLVHFTNHYHFFRHPPPPWILDGLLTYWSYWRVDICIAHTQNRSTCCAFLQSEWHKIINRSLFFDSWHVILLANASQRFLEVGCAFFSLFHPGASTVLQGWSLGRAGWERGCGTRQADRSRPISCSQLLHLSSPPNPARAHTPSARSDMNTLSRVVGERM